MVKLRTVKFIYKNEIHYITASSFCKISSFCATCSFFKKKVFKDLAKQICNIFFIYIKPRRNSFDYSKNSCSIQVSDTCLEKSYRPYLLF